MAIFLTILGIALAIILNCVIADQFHRCAIDKGYEERRFFWFPFFFGLIGYLMVIALPDRGDEPGESIIRPAPRAEIGGPASQNPPVNCGTKTCPKCGTVQLANRARCINCGEMLF